MGGTIQGRSRTCFSGFRQAKTGWRRIAGSAMQDLRTREWDCYFKPANKSQYALYPVWWTVETHGKWNRQSRGRILRQNSTGLTNIFKEQFGLTDNYRVWCNQPYYCIWIKCSGLTDTYRDQRRTFFRSVTQLWWETN